MRRVKLLHAKPRGAPDVVFLSAAAALVIFGLVMLASASSDLSLRERGDSYAILLHQITNGFLLGVAGFLVGYFFYYRNWERFAVPLFILGIIALLLVWSPIGVTEKGSARWVSVKAFSFQPGELVKLTLIIYLASWLSRTPLRAKHLGEGFLPFLLIVGLVVALLLLQPATSTALIIVTGSLILYFMGGARIRFFALAVVVAIAAFGAVIATTPYRLERVEALLNPTADPLGTGYHLSQAKLAIGAGGVTGVGFGQSTTKLHYLPEPLGDSIFAIIGEELGFVGTGALLACFTILVIRGFAIARKAPDPFGRLMAVGFVSIIGLQAFVNIAATSGLIPPTGVPLPFISYGGTALAVFLTMTGIIGNISRYAR